MAAEGKCMAFCKALEKLTALRSVYVGSHCDNDTVGTLKWLCSSLSPPPLLRSLTLIGKMQMTPAWFGNLTQLVKIYLKRSCLKDLEVLGVLPNLMLLELRDYAYRGEKLTFRTGAFPSLRKLVITESGMTGMRFEDCASPCMEIIHIEWSLLQSGIVGIRHLPMLKEISFGRECYVAGLNMLQGEADRHCNQPVLRLEGSRSYHDLAGMGGEEEGSKPQSDDAQDSSQEITRTDDS